MDKLLDFCHDDEGISFEELLAVASVGKEELVTGLNDLLSESKIEIVDSKEGLRYRSKQASSFHGQLGDEEKTLLSLIESSRNYGVWVRDLKQKSGLHQTVLNKALKQLESRLLVRPIKSLKFPTRKIYVGYAIKSLDESKYSNWYTDSEIDGELVGKVIFVLKKIFESRPDSQLSSIEVLEILRDTKILSTEVSEDEVNQILDVLVLEEIVTRTPSKPQSYMLRPMAHVSCGLSYCSFT